MLAAIVSVAGAATITVDDSGSADYLSIQDAVNSASTGYTILVHEGTYVENTNVNVENLTIKSLGNLDNTIIRPADPYEDIFFIGANGITVDGFYITGAANYRSGIYVYGVSDCTIVNNTVIQNSEGITFNSCKYSTLLNNNVTWNTIDGVSISNSHNNNFIKNTIVENNECGIEADNSNGNEITFNTISGNNYDGINFHNSSSCSISNNTLAENDVGFSFYNLCENNIITNNNVTSDFEHDNSIIVVDCSNNTIFNNYFEGRAVCEGLTHNTWNSTKTTGPNIIGGPYIGGNYWAISGGGGFSQTHADTNGDGISETPYVLSLNDVDRLPLSTLTEEYDLLIGGSTTLYPVAELVTQGYEAANPNFSLMTSGIGSGAGILSVALGNTDIGMASRALKESEKATYPDLESYDVGGTAYVIIANKNSTDSFNVQKSDLANAYRDNHLPQNLTKHGISVLIQREGEPASEHFVRKWLGIGINESILNVVSNEEMLHTIENTENTLGFVPFRLARSSDKISILGLIDDDGNIYDSSYVDEEHIKHEIKSILENEVTNIGENYLPQLVPHFFLITNGEPDTLERSYIEYMQSAHSVQYFEQGYAYSIYELNEKPSASIRSIIPYVATEGTVVSFNGSGMDPDGTIVDYTWMSSIDGHLSNLSSFSTSNLSAGNHSIFFSVKDNGGLWSDFDSSVLIINGIMNNETISIGSSIVYENSSVTIPVKLSDVNNITGFSFDLLYNSNVVVFEDISYNNSFSEMSISSNIDNSNGIARVALTCTDLLTLSSPVPVMLINFNATGSYGDSTDLELYNVELSGTDFIPYSPGLVINGSITIGIEGDFNNNGRVDIGDVSKVAFMVVGKVPEDLIADFNDNERVDIGDASKIAFYLSGKVSEL